ncbi:MAG: Do family serine endopeptidase [Bacteroidota bacterium]
MSRKQFFLGIILAAVLGAGIAVSGVIYFQPKQQTQPIQQTSFEDKQNVYLSNFLKDSAFVVPAGLNFVYAAEQATPAVVHIRSEYESGVSASSSPFEDMFRDFFGDQQRNYRRQQPQPARSSGSGVIISADGYVATNNHVVENADKISVTLNDNRKYDAQVIGTDPTTDLALLKIDGNNFDYLEFGNSDNVKIGEWVLAVGNPFDLTSTVTAGIVSAKARNINILRDRNGLQIESFIQTDAAVNPGNSGGALVNLKGELIGINTAIATPTGTYAGYSFAVPVSLVQKVMDDLLEFGVVQRALLGIRIVDVSAELAEDRDFEELTGVYISEVGSGSAADDAGLKAGDVIIAINDHEVKNVAELQEAIALNRPGDQVEVTYVREGNRKTTDATLKGASGTTDIVVKTASYELEGAVFEDVNEEEANELRIQGGAKIAELDEGKWKSAGIRESFIITSIDKKDINSVGDLQETMARKRGGILIEGVYPSGETAYYGMGW